MEFLFFTSLTSIYSMFHINKGLRYIPFAASFIVIGYLLFSGNITFTESFGVYILYFLLPFFCISWILTVILCEVPIIKRFLNYCEPNYN